MKIKYLLFVSIFLNSFFCYAQAIKTTVSIPSPNVASLGTYGEIPISHFTGTPNISIPIYELKSSHFNLPITLSYHPALRPESHPGWTGIGWNLSCGGVITRKQNKAIDEESTTFFGNTGFYYQSSALNNVNWASNLSNYNKYPYDKDTEADEFNFNFMGYNGKFFLDENGIWRVQSDQYLKISFAFTDFALPFIYNTPYGLNSQGYISKAIKKFVITDMNGTKYTFGGVENAIEYSDELLPPNIRRGEFFYATSWYLTKIESSDNVDVVNLNYIRGPFLSYLYPSYSTFQSSSTFGSPFNFLGNCSGNNSSNFGFNLSGRIVSPVYLSDIQFPNQSLKINFIASKCNDLNYQNHYYQFIIDNYFPINPPPYTWPAYGIVDITDNIFFDNPNDESILPRYKRFIWRKLDAISIINTSTNQSIKSVSFNYRENSTSRLRLNSISFKTSNAINIQNYIFGYNDDNLLQDYLSVLGDHWGFNNNPAFMTGIPTGNFLSVRQPTESFTKAEVLKKITYPTGGSTEFEFEINRYSSIVSQDRQTLLSENDICGGLRIKKIINKDYDLTVSPIIKEYLYVKNYFLNTNPHNPVSFISSGILDTKPKYYFNNITGLSLAGVAFTYSFLSSNPVIPLTQNSSGTHISYSEIVEKRQDGSYTIYKYSNHDNGFKDSPPLATFNAQNISYLPFCSRDFERGMLISKKEYNNNGILLAEITNQYSRINEQLKASKSLNNSFFVVPNCGAAGQAVTRVAYLHYYYPFKLTSEISKVYPQETLLTLPPPITQTKNFVYDDYKNLIRESLINSKEHLIKNEYNYFYNYTGLVYSDMVNKNIINPIIEKRQENFTLNKEISKTQTEFAFWQNNTIIKPLSIKNSIGNNLLSTDLILEKYDEKGNILQTKDRNGILTSYFWGYNFQYPVAKVINKIYDVLLAQSNLNLTAINNPACSDGDMRFELNKLRNISNCYVTSYTYKPLIGITSETDPNNRTKYYEYDNFNRLSLIRDQDNNILKKICYNYSGQIVDCVIPCPPNSPANWQNTSAPPTCQQGICGNTGYQLQEQIDMNTCSPTSGNTRFVQSSNTVVNCPTGAMATITYQNLTGDNTFIAKYYNTSTMQYYTFSVPASGSGTLGCIPAGRYTLNISRPGIEQSIYDFGNGCTFISGSSSAFFGRVFVPSCSNVHINWAD